MKAIIFHGTKGSPEANWFPWLKGKLDAEGWDVRIPALPTPENQSPETWLKALKEQVRDYSETQALIGHSLGATFVLHLLESGLCKTDKTVLVAPVLDEIGIPEYDVLNAPFIRRSFYWETICQNAGDIFILHGDDDPYVPLEQARQIGQHLHTTPRLIRGGGHLNAESGYTELPVLLDILDAP